MSDRDLMQQALEALEAFLSDELRPYEAAKTSAALRAAIDQAQPEQEPVDSPEKAGAHMDARLWEFIDMAAAWPEAKPDSRIWGHVLVYAPKQPQMQPCAGRNCGSTNPNLHSAECFEDYEKSTGMNQWQGLTNEEIEHIADSEWEEAFVRMIEAKLKEKNT